MNLFGTPEIHVRTGFKLHSKNGCALKLQDAYLGAHPGAHLALKLHAKSKFF